MKMSRPLILASGSPRRQFLMREVGFEFAIEKPDVEENFPEDLPIRDVARYLAMKKAEVFRGRLSNEIVVTADTVVVVDNRILNKPQNRNEAIEMLQTLSGNTHTVITGVCLLTAGYEESFDDETNVTFKSLSPADIQFYVDNYKPYDKAGAYGAQDWIGMVAIEKIEGSYFNVMGLPIHRVYDRLCAIDKLP